MKTAVNWSFALIFMKKAGRSIFKLVFDHQDLVEEGGEPFPTEVESQWFNFERNTVHVQ